MDILTLVLGFLLVILVVFVSWRSIWNPRSHGFYRFFGFLATTVLLIENLPYWVDMAQPTMQILSFLLLVISLVFVLWGVTMLRLRGGQQTREQSPETLSFENTSQLVTTGLYRYIRHPMYSSLLFLTWGTFLKQITMVTIVATVVATVAYYLTARMEERENIEFFGESYLEYMKESKMFIPFLY